MLLLLFGDCSCGTGCAAGADEIIDHEGAPYSLTDVHAVLWAAAPENDEQDAEAALIFTTAELDCADFTDVDVYDDIDATLLEGSGLIFLLEQRSYDTDEDPLSGWTGLWMGEAYAENQRRSAYSFAFDQGQVYMLGSYYGGGDTWLDIASTGEDDLKGSFSTTFWSGGFTATRCGYWAENGGEESGWYDDTY